MSFVLLVCFSFVCSLVVVLGARLFSGLQGNEDATICYYGLAPAVMFVGLISGFRGYFQGLQNMTPSAVSGFFEQIFKMIFGLYLAGVFIDKGVSYGVLGALLGISISELCAFVYLFLHYLVARNKFKNKLLSGNEILETRPKTAKQILSLSFFVTLGGLIMPLTMLIDSGVVINILKSIGYSVSEATALFGLQTGTVGSIINMPVVLSLGVATAILPHVSAKRAKGDFEGVKKAASKAVSLAVIFALPSSVGCLTFAEPIIKLLYGRSLGMQEILVASRLLEVASISIFYLALVQVTSGLLQGLNKFYVPLISLASGGGVKIVLNLLLVRIPEINILGGEVASTACYMVALFINLACLKKMGVIKLENKIFAVLFLSGAIYFSKLLFNWLLTFGLNYYLSLIFVVTFVIIIYFVSIFLLYRHGLKDGKIYKSKIKKV